LNHDNTLILMNTDKSESWHDLLVWQKAHTAALAVFNVVKGFPPEECHRLSDRLCRAALAVPTGIAEGKGRGSVAEFRQALTAARGSVEETRYLLLLARDLGYLTTVTHAAIESAYAEISKMVTATLKSLKTSGPA